MCVCTPVFTLCICISVCVHDYMYVWCVCVCIHTRALDVRGTCSLSLCRIQTTSLAAGVSVQPTISPPMVPFLNVSFVRHPSNTLVDRALLVSVLMLGLYFVSPGLPQKEFGFLIQCTG